MVGTEAIVFALSGQESRGAAERGSAEEESGRLSDGGLESDPVLWSGGSETEHCN